MTRETKQRRDNALRLNAIAEQRRMTADELLDALEQRFLSDATDDGPGATDTAERQP